MLQSMGSQSVRHNLTSEQQQHGNLGMGKTLNCLLLCFSIELYFISPQDRPGTYFITWQSHMQVASLPWHNHIKIWLEFLDSVQFRQSCPTFVAPWTAMCQASLSITSSQTLLKLMSIESVMPSNHLIHCGPLLLLPSIFPSISVFSSESTLHMRWPKVLEFQLQQQSFG